MYSQFPTIPTYYNPTIRPSNVGDKFLVVSFQDDRIGKYSYSFPRIFCVAKQDPETIKLTELVSTVMDKFDKPSTGLRHFTFYDETTGLSIGLVGVTSAKVRPQVPWEEGFICRAIDLDLRYIVESRHL